MKKLAIISSHPIQYYAPVFKLLAQTPGVDVKVFYTWGEDSIKKYDPGFGKMIEWDVPLLEGYDHRFLHNTSKNPGTHHFWGIVNPGAKKEIEAYKPDAVLVYGWSWHSHLSLMRNFKGQVPVYFRGDSTLIDTLPGWKSMVRSLFLKRVYSTIDKAFYTGSSNKLYFIKHGIAAHNLNFAPHAIDNARFGSDFSAAAHQLRAALGIPDGDMLILFAGKLEEKKDPERLLKSFAELHNRKVHLLFTGNGKLEDQLKSQSRAFGVSGRVYFHPFQNQSTLPAYYHAADLFCLPSKGPGETWGLAVNEAMACGKAVLVSDKTGCAADLVRPGVNGEVFRSGNVADLKNKLETLLANNVALADMGKQSAQIIADFSFNRQAAAIAQTILQA